ncbi:MAG: hypothetical protein AAGC93_22985 [Cyanobacteria bacterium P01_F01_bin.53]
MLAPINQYFDHLINTHTVWLVISVIGAVLLHNILAECHYFIVDLNRSKKHQQWAYKHRWKYKANKDQALYRRYRFLEGLLTKPSKLSQAIYPCAVHSFQRSWKSYRAIAYTRYSKVATTRENGSHPRSKKISRHYQAITLIHTQGDFPTLLLYPYGWTDRLFEFVTWIVTWIAPSPRTFVTLTNKQSGKKYQISADDYTAIEQFAHAEMMDYLFEHPGLEIKLGKDAIALYQKGRLKPENIERNLEHLHQIHTRLPPSWKSEEKTDVA